MKNFKCKIAACVLLAGCLVLAGCSVGQQVPRAKITLNPVTGQFSSDNPKDLTIQELESGITTNGVRYLRVKGLTTVMNPAVVTETGKAEANEITARGAAAVAILDKIGGITGTVSGAVASGGTTEVLKTAISVAGNAARPSAPVVTPPPASAPASTNAPAQ